MTDNEELDHRTTTFSQAQGYEPIPGPLALEMLSQEARVRLLDLLLYTACERYRGEWQWNWDTDWRPIFHMLHRELLGQPRDAFPASVSTVVQVYRELILNDLAFHKVFDLFQMIMRHPLCPVDFTLGVAAIFRECQLAYVVYTDQPATILPAVTEQEGKTIIGAINELREAGLSGAEVHLRTAGEFINGGDWAGSVRESIHAVESVARQVDPKTSNTLPDALKSLQRSSGRLHPALKDGFEKLYAYTSDEEGIRHSLMDNAESSVGRDEAMFMLGACASFASYLWRRHQSGS